MFILYTETFERDFKKLDKSVQKRVDKKIRWIAEHPELLRQPLRHMSKNLEDLQKIRVGDFRVLLWVDHAKDQITLYSVEHRSTVYRDF